MSSTCLQISSKHINTIKNTEAFAQSELMLCMFHALAKKFKELVFLHLPHDKIHEINRRRQSKIRTNYFKISNNFTVPSHPQTTPLKQIKNNDYNLSALMNQQSLILNFCHHLHHLHIATWVLLQP